MNNNQFEEFDNVTLLSEKEVFQKIFTEPKIAFEYIHKNHFEKHFITLLITIGIANSLDNVLEKIIAGNIENVVLSVSLSVLLGGFLGWISFYFFGALISWTGKWYNGKGNTDDFVRMMAYCNLPTFVSLAVTIIQLIFIKTSPDFFYTQNIHKIMIYGFSAISILIGIWSATLCVIGISVVQKFSYGKAFLNYISALGVVIVPIVIIILLISK